MNEETLRRCFLALLFSCLFLAYSPLGADIEPSLEGLLPAYFIAAVEGDGNVQILKEGQTQWREAPEGTRLEEGDRILAGDGTEVILSLQFETLVHLDEDTEVTVSQLEENSSNGFKSRLRLLTGSVLCDVDKNISKTGSKFEVDTGGIVCDVWGTVFEVASNSNPIRISTDEGVVRVSNSAGSQPVPAGDTCLAAQGRSLVVHPSHEETKARFQAWRQIRDKVLKKWFERGQPQPKTSLPIGNPSRNEYRLGPNDISAE